MGQNYNDDGIIKRWVVMTAEILGAKDITNTEKIVLAYISSFEEYFASNESAGDFLGLTARTVQGAKQNLVRLGYVKVIKDTGRGRIYQFNTARLTKFCQSGSQNSVNQNDKILSPENKYENKEETKTRDDVEKSEFGRADINALVTLWEKETGISIQGEQLQRRQIYNLTRKYGCERVKVLVRLVGDAIRSRDRFAPQIAKPSDLVGKYGKLEKLKMWNDRRKPQLTPAPSMAMASLKKPKPYEMGNISDEEHDRVSEMFKEARQKLLK